MRSCVAGRERSNRACLHHECRRNELWPFASERAQQRVSEAPVKLASAFAPTKRVCCVKLPFTAEGTELCRSDCRYEHRSVPQPEQLGLTPSAELGMKPSVMAKHGGKPGREGARESLRNEGQGNADFGGGAKCRFN